jgi:hypothetical protein
MEQEPSNRVAELRQRQEEAFRRTLHQLFPDGELDKAISQNPAPRTEAERLERWEEIEERLASVANRADEASKAEPEVDD